MKRKGDENNGKRMEKGDASQEEKTTTWEMIKKRDGKSREGIGREDTEGEMKREEEKWER